MSGKIHKVLFLCFLAAIMPAYADKPKIPDCAIDVMPSDIQVPYKIRHELHSMASFFEHVIMIDIPPQSRTITSTIDNSEYDFRIVLQERASSVYVSGAPFGTPKFGYTATFELVRANVERFPEWARKIPAQPLQTCEFWRDGKDRVLTAQLPTYNPAKCQLEWTETSGDVLTFEINGKDANGNDMVRANFSLTYPEVVKKASRQASYIVLKAVSEGRCKLM